MSKKALERAISIVGNASALANLIGLTKGAVSQWKDDGRRIPAEHCPSIERATNGVVRCEDLRPDVDWGYLRAATNTASVAQLTAKESRNRRKEDKAQLNRRASDVPAPVCLQTAHLEFTIRREPDE